MRLGKRVANRGGAILGQRPGAKTIKGALVAEIGRRHLTVERKQKIGMLIGEPCPFLLRPILRSHRNKLNRIITARRRREIDAFVGRGQRVIRLAGILAREERIAAVRTKR